MRGAHRWHFCNLPGVALVRRHSLCACGNSAFGAQWRKAAIAFHSETSHRALGSKADKKEVAVVAQREVDGGRSRSRDCCSRIEQTQRPVWRNKITGDRAASGVRYKRITIVLRSSDPAIRGTVVKDGAADQFQGSVVVRVVRGHRTGLCFRY